MAVSKIDLQMRFAKAYVARVSHLPQLREVILDHRDGEVHIWTFVEAEPMKLDAVEPFYQAELQTYREFPSIEVEFHLKNVREYREKGVEPSPFLDASRLWPRNR